jgi:hypothetical protein
MYIKEYFDGLADWLENNRSGKDDMLQEGFNSAVEYGQISFRLVDQSTMKCSYNDCVIEDGVLYLQVCVMTTMLLCLTRANMSQTSLRYLGVNLHDIADNLMDVLQVRRR